MSTRVLKSAIQERKNLLTVFDDMIADVTSNKKLHPIVTNDLLVGRKLNISLVFITQSYFPVPKDARLNTKFFFIMNIPTDQSFNQL